MSRAARARCRRSARVLINRRAAQLGGRRRGSQALSPLAVLARGYAIALHEPTGSALLRAGDAAPGDTLRVRLHEGELRRARGARRS